MKRDTQQRPGVGKNAPASAVADPRAASAVRQVVSAAATGASVTPSVTLSARYIDSRLKQFTCR